MTNDFIWYELITSNADAAQAFYGAVVGWTFGDSGQAGMDYRVLMAEDVAIGGLMATPTGSASAGMKPSWYAYVAVPDVDAVVARFEGAGGTVWMPARTMDNVGRMAMVADPQGAALYVMTPAMSGPDGNGSDGNGNRPSPYAPNKPGHVGWNELHTSDGDAALAFYTQHLGWRHTSDMDMGPMGQYHLFSGGGEAPLGGMMSDGNFPHPLWLYYLNVDNIDTASQRVVAAGGTILHGPHAVPTGMWIIIGLDPQGAMFSLLGPKIT